MRKKDEEVIEKVVNKIIDSKVLLTGDGDFYVTTLKGEIIEIIIRNLFSPNSKIRGIAVKFNSQCFDWDEVPRNEFGFRIWYNTTQDRPNAVFWEIDLDASPSFKRLVEYVKENKQLILHNDKEYGKYLPLTDADFI